MRACVRACMLGRVCACGCAHASACMTTCVRTRTHALASVRACGRASLRVGKRARACVHGSVRAHLAEGAVVLLVGLPVLGHGCRRPQRAAHRGTRAHTNTRARPRAARGATGRSSSGERAPSPVPRRAGRGGEARVTRRCVARAVWRDACVVRPRVRARSAGARQWRSRARERVRACTQTRARAHTHTHTHTHTHRLRTGIHTRGMGKSGWAHALCQARALARGPAHCLMHSGGYVGARAGARAYAHAYAHAATAYMHTCAHAHARAAPLPPSFPRPELSDGALRAHAPLSALKARGVQKCARTRAHACVRARACVLRVCTRVRACSAWQRTRARCGRRESARASGRHERATWHAVGLAAVVHHEAERRVHGRVALVPVRARKRGGGPERTTQCV